MHGPAGTGKSLAALHKLHLAMLKYEGAKGLIVRKTAASLTSTTLATWYEHVIQEAQATGEVRYYGGSQSKPPAFLYKHSGSSINIGGMDKPSKIMSSDYDLIVADEATELVINDWESMITRLRHGAMPYQQAIAACNPDAPHHFLWQRANAGGMTALHSRHQDNPRYYTVDGQLTPQGLAYVVGKLGRLTGVRRLRLLDGIWAAAEGLVYEGYNPADHLVDRFPIPDSWARYWSIDFGYTNPLTVQFWAQDNDGRLYLYREIYHTQRLVEDIAKQVMGIVAPGGQWIEPQPQAIVCDHDAEARKTFERHTGLGTVPAQKDVTNGIQMVQTRLQPAGDALPRLYVLRDSLVERDMSLHEAGKPCCLAEELPSYVWKRGLDGRPVPEEPVKENDHGCDAMRYLAMHHDWTSHVYFRGWH